MALRVGTTHFKNTDFIFYPIQKGMVSPNGSSYQRAHPPQLGKLLLEGSVDIGPTSSIIYGQHHRDLLILPDFSISAYGKTMSILLFSDSVQSLDDLEGKRVAVPGTSASSSALLRIILAMKGIEAEIVYHERPDLDAMLRVSDAALLIGDHALKANYSGREVLTDLGEEWAHLTGKKMVYALWVIRREAARKDPEGIRAFHRTLTESREAAYRNLETVSSALADELGVSNDFMTHHLTTLDYGLGDEGMEGLKEYFKQAHRYGVLEEMPEINVFEV